MSCYHPCHAHRIEGVSLCERQLWMAELDASWITHDSRHLVSTAERFPGDTLSNHTAAKQCNFHVFCTPFPFWDSLFHDGFCQLDGASGGNHLLAARAARTFRAGPSTAPDALASAPDLRPL